MDIMPSNRMMARQGRDQQQCVAQAGFHRVVLHYKKNLLQAFEQLLHPVPLQGDESPSTAQWLNGPTSVKTVL